MSGASLWDALISLRDEQRSQRANGLQVVKGSELPLESNPLGLIQWYLHPTKRDTVLSTHIFYRQEIPPDSRSGKLHCQGGQVMFILEGKGRTVIDGVEHRWEAGDVLNLPLKRDGIVIQHFNADATKRALFLSTEVNLTGCVGVDRGSGFELLEPSPDYRSNVKGQ
jgi:gentisate 1,2-dioxygenase